MAATPLTRRIVERLAEDHVPWEVTLEITKYCNFDCVHCYVPRDQLGARRELTLDEIRRFLDDFRALGGMTVHLTGGEVMVHRHFLDILRHAQSLHLAFHISSNGSRVDEATADALRDLDVSHLSVSLYGATPETDERVTRRRGSHRTAMRGLRLLASRGIVVKLKLPVMRSNVHDIGERVAIARALGFPFSIDAGMTPKSNGDRVTEAERIDPATWRVLRKRIDEEFTPWKSGAADRALRPGPGFVPLPPQPRTRAAFCNVGLTFCAVDSYGDVFPCIAFPAVAGNIREQSFAEVWREAPLFRRLREATLADVQGCSTCDVSQTCSRCIGHAHLIDGDMMGPSSIDCHRMGKAPPTYFGAGRC